MADPFEFPTTLTLKQQGLFVLGYYHQCAGTRSRHQGSQGAQVGTRQITRAEPVLSRHPEGSGKV